MKFFIKFAPALIVGILTFICYCGSIHNQFVYDDSSYVVDNHQIRSFSFIPEYFTNLCSYQGTGHEGQFKVFRPLVTLSFAIDYYLYGLNPSGFHFTNILLHFLSGIIIYYFFLKLSGTFSIALLTALIFICHPSQVESVAWISGRGNMLYAIFAIFSLYSFFNYFSIGKRKYLFFTVIFFALALLSKETALNVIPLSIVIYLLYLNKPDTTRKKFLKLISYLCLTAIIYILYRFMVIKTVSQTTYWGGSIFTTFFTMTYVLKKYLLQLMYPINHNVLPDIALITSILNLKFILSALFLFTAGVICLRKKNPLYLKTGFLWIILCLIPVSNIIPLRALYAERFLYLSIAGFGFIAANLLKNVKHTYRYIISFALLTIFSFETVKTNFSWKSNYNLWTNVLRYDQNNAEAHNGIGIELLARNKLIPAVTAFQTAHSLNPNDMFILNNLAVAYNKSGDKEKALNLLKTAETEGKNKAVINHNIALLYMDDKNYKTALPYLLESIRIDKNYANAYNSLGICYANLKDNSNAVSCWIKAIDLMPFWEEAYYNLIIFLIKTNAPQQAEKYIKTAVKKFPHSKIFSFPANFKRIK